MKVQSGTPILEAKDVGKAFSLDGKSLPVISNISFSVSPGEICVFLGRSGCGKSTLLRILAGLTPADSGDVHLRGARLLGPSPDIAILFQSYAVFPWMTARGNVEAGLLRRGLSRAHRRALAQEYLAKVGLAEFAGARPASLSGGMQQRVALARTYATNASVLLMDEPFAALDALTRQEMQTELLRLHREEGKAVVFVTHDVEEATRLASTLFVLGGRPASIAASFNREGGISADAVSKRLVSLFHH